MSWSILIVRMRTFDKADHDALKGGCSGRYFLVNFSIRRRFAQVQARYNS